MPTNLAKPPTTLGFPVYIIALGEAETHTKTDFGTLVTVNSSLLSFNVTALPGLPWFSYKFSLAIRSIMREYPSVKPIIWGIGPWGLAASFLKIFFRTPIVHINSYFTTTKHEWRRSLQALSVSDYGLLIPTKFFLIYHTIVRFLTVLERIVLSTSDVIVTNYLSTERILTEQFSKSKNKFIRTPFPIEAYIRSSKNKKIADPIQLPKQYILYLSRHDPRKGVNVLLHAAKILKNRGTLIPLLIGGTGELYLAHQRLSKKLGLDRWVTFMGFVPDATQLMRHATLFCLPTLEEGAGALIINEAMSYKLPIVTTLCDGIVEDIKNETSGLLVPMGNPQALARALERLIHSPSLRQKLSRNAYTQYKYTNNQTKIKEDIYRVLQKSGAI